MSLALNIVDDSHNHQGNEGANKIYFLIKRDFFWVGMWKVTDKFIQIYTYANNITFKNNPTATCTWNPNRQFDTIACDIIGPYTPLRSKSKLYVLIYVCLLTNIPIVIPMPNKLAEKVFRHACNMSYATFHASLILIPESDGNSKTAF